MYLSEVANELNKLTDSELITVSEELNSSVLPEDSLIRKLLPKGMVFALAMIELNVLVRNEMTMRYKALSNFMK